MDILVLTIPSILFRWPSFTLLLDYKGNSSFCHTNSEMWDVGLENLDSINSSPISFAFVQKLINREEIQLISPRLHFVFFGEPNDLMLLISKISSNQLHHSWFIVVNESEANVSQQLQLPHWMNILKHLDIAYESEIYFAVMRQKIIQIFEIYRICSKCPNTVLEVCSVLENGSLYGSNCYKDLFERRKNLQGIKINVVAVDALPFMTFVSVTSNGIAQVNGGLFGTIFSIIMDQLNFTYNLRILQGYRYGSFNNGSWNGMLGYLSRNEVDMTVSELSMTEDRLLSVEFSSSFDSVGRKIYVRKIIQDKNINWRFYSAPFSALLHISVIFSIAQMTLLLLLDERYHKANKSFTLSESFWIAFSSVCQKGAHIIPPGRTSKITFAVFSFTFLIAFCAYSATLISQLAVAPPLAIPFKDLQDFVVKGKNWKAGPIKNDLTQIYMEKTCPHLLKTGENSQCELLVQLWNKVVKVEKETLPLSFNEGLARVLQEKFAFIATSLGVRNYIANNLTEKDGCSVLELNGDYISSNLAFGLRKNFPYKNLINYKILQLRKSGLLRRLQKTWLPQQKQCLNSQSSNFKDATIYDVGVAPLIGLLGFCISFLILCLEMFIWRADWNENI